MKQRVTRACLVVALQLLLISVQAQTDSAKVNTLSFGLNFMTHGEIVRGGLPVDGDALDEEKSSFLLGRTRLIVDFHRPGLEAHAVIQNKSVWGSGGNQALNLYEGWVKMMAKNGLFAQLGRIALSYDDERHRHQ